MSVTSNRTVSIAFSGDVTYQQDFAAASSSAGSGQNQNIALSSGANTITVPSGAVGVTIIPPVTNTTITLTLKGISGDTGIALAKESPTSIALSSVSTFVITTSSTITVRFIYS